MGGWGVSRSLARTLAASAVLGAVAGGLVGILGRLAMRLLAVTSPSTAQGRITDDQARVGEITLTGTLAIVVLTVFAGAMLGLAYPLVRRILPAGTAVRVACFGLLTGAIGGSILVHDHPSFDYTVLEPTWLAVTLFISVPAAWGALTALLVERVDRPEGWVRRLPLLVVVGAGLLVSIPTLLITAVPVALALLASLSERLRTAWASTFLTRLGYVVYAVLLGWAVYGLATDIWSLAKDSPSRAPFTL